jgi:hypothetical protein
MKVANKSFENVIMFKYLGITIYQKCLLKEIKSRLNSGDAFNHAVQNLSSYICRLWKVKIKIYKTLILPVILYVCETWSPMFWEEQGAKENTPVA